MSARLPVVGSTAASTAFCSATITGPGPRRVGVLEDVHENGLRLHFDGNGKITAGNGTLLEPRPNALSTVQVEDCPQSTETCRKACYVHNLEAAQKSTHDLFRENSKTLRTILESPELAEAWTFLVAAWIREHAPGGFRFHVSGDIFSRAHAAWIRDVCLEVGPDIQCWIYTRSFRWVEELMPAATLATGGVSTKGNLSINLSCDRDNLSSAVFCVRYHRGPSGSPRLCYLAVSPDDNPDLMYLRADDVIFPDYALRPRGHASFAEAPWWQALTAFQRGLVCPVDAVGKAENRRCGPCERCLK